MANDGAGAGAGAGSADVGSPLAGAVAPGAARRMSDLGVGGQPSAANARSMSDLGMPANVGAAQPGEKMVPLSPFGNPEMMHEELTRELAAEPTTNTEQPEETQAQPEEVQQEEQQPEGVLTAEQKAAKYDEWLNSDQIPDELLDRPIWIDDGNGGSEPIRLRDIKNNVLMYKDYQRKTTKLAEGERKVEAYNKGRQRWIEDMNSGDPVRGLRAIRGVGADKTLENIVVQFVQDMARMERMDPADRARLIRAQQLEDENYYLRQNYELQQQQAREEAERQAAEQGINAPDVKYVQDSIQEQLPLIYKELNVQDSELMDHLLGPMLAEAASGQRDPRTGQWIVAPTIQLGRKPSKDVLTRIVLAAKQKAEAMTAGGLSRPAAQTPPTKPLQGSGPAAKPGTRGNISQPEQRRFSDLAQGGVRR